MGLTVSDWGKGERPQATGVTELWKVHSTPQKAFPEQKKKKGAAGSKNILFGPEHLTVPSRTVKGTASLPSML